MPAISLDPIPGNTLQGLRSFKIKILLYAIGYIADTLYIGYIASVLRFDPPRHTCGRFMQAENYFWFKLLIFILRTRDNI
jgi:hypothetical protein